MYISINNNLEQQAMALYDYWFTQFNFPNNQEKPYNQTNGIFEYCDILKKNIPLNWKVMKITDVADIYQPQTISNDLFDDKANYNVYGGGGLIGKYSSYNHENSEVIISCRGNCGNFYFTSPKSWITGNAMVVSPNQTLLSKYYVFHYLKRYGVKQFLTGSVQKQLTRENLSGLNILIPPKTILNSFDNIIKPMYDKIIQIRLETSKLISFRNYLLPLLMNGQATIDE